MAKHWTIYETARYMKLERERKQREIREFGIAVLGLTLFGAGIAWARKKFNF